MWADFPFRIMSTKVSQVTHVGKEAMADPLMSPGESPWKGDFWSPLKKKLKAHHCLRTER